MKKILIILSFISLLGSSNILFSAYDPTSIVSWLQQLQTQKDDAKLLINLIDKDGINPQIIRKANKIMTMSKGSLEHLPEITDTHMQTAEDMLQVAIDRYNERDFDAAKVALKKFCQSIIRIGTKQIEESNILLADVPANQAAWNIELQNLKGFAHKLKTEIDKEGIDSKKVREAKNILIQINKAKKYLPQILFREIEIARNELQAAIDFYNDYKFDAAAAALKTFCRSIMRLATEESQEVARSVPGPGKPQE